MHLWSLPILKRIGDSCGGFLAIEEDAVFLSDFRWARIRVKWDGKPLPQSVEVSAGSCRFVVQLWWEVQQCLGFASVVRRSEKGEVMRVDEGGDAHAEGRERHSVNNRLHDNEGTIELPSSRERTSSPSIQMQSGEVVSGSGSALGFVPSPKSGTPQFLGPNEVGLSKAKDHLGLSNMGALQRDLVQAHAPQLDLLPKPNGH